jgi:hypothetical protein
LAARLMETRGESRRLAWIARHLSARLGFGQVGTKLKLRVRPSPRGAVLRADRHRASDIAKRNGQRYLRAANDINEPVRGSWAAQDHRQCARLTDQLQRD